MLRILACLLPPTPAAQLEGVIDLHVGTSVKSCGVHPACDQVRAELFLARPQRLVIQEDGEQSPLRVRAAASTSDERAAIIRDSGSRPRVLNASLRMRLGISWRA